MRLLVAIALLATWARADDPVGVCAPSCVLGSGFSSEYETGMQYKYQYTGKANTKAKAGQEESSLSLKAEVVITANTACDLKLQVANVVVEDASEDEAKWFSEAVQEHDLHFSYQHGTITHLCPHEEEEAVATNFKRGILSALQMTVRKDASDVVVSEVDVTGQCDTKYSMTTGSGLEVTKTKTGCHTKSYIPHLPHSQYTNTMANTQLPFAKSSQRCVMQGSAGGGAAWQKVECTEEVQVQRPFKAGSEALALITLSSTLSLDEGPTPMSSNFSKGEEMRKTTSLVADLKAAVEFAEMKKQQADDVKEQIESSLESLSASESAEGEEELRPRLFSNLIHLLGQLEEEQLQELWDDSSSEKAKRKVLLDGLLVCDASPCHAVVVGLAGEQGQLTPGQVNMWLAGLHFHTAADPSLVTQLLDLAKSKEGESAALMASSSVVHRLCQQQPGECSTVAQPFLEFVDQEVGELCGEDKTKQQQEHIKLVLRAVGNAGVMPSDDFPERCYMNRALPPELRVTALQTYRRTGCPANSEALWMHLEHDKEKSEVRIAAYLALVPCAADSPFFFTRLHRLLEKEEVQQVYAFIWTHVKNMIEQPGPSQQEQTLSKLARQHSLPDRFNNDAFRFSGHFRYTDFSESMNYGTRMDATVVYSQDSFLPRQASANLTLDILDNSFNFLDFGGEFSGVESIIEDFFGKEGYFANEDILKVLQTLRPKRNIIHDDKIQEFQKMYDEGKGRKKLGAEQDGADKMEEEEEEAKASFYVRMFGNEVFYVENVMQYSPPQLLYHLIQQISSPKIFKIIDQEYMAPTFLGFPLRLRLNATASVKIQPQHTFRNNRESGLLLEGSLNPTVVAAMDETLMVDAFVASSGLRRSSTQLAKMNIGAKFSYKDGEVTELQVSVPDEEVAAVSSSVTLALLKDGGKWEELEGASVMKENDCVGTFEEAVGLKTCTSLSRNTYEADGQQVTVEPYTSEFKMMRTDTFKYYKLYIKLHENLVEVLFDTPGSSHDRKFHFIFNVNPDREGGYIIVRGAGYGIKGQYKNTQEEVKLQLQYMQESEVLGELEVSLKEQEEGSSVEYVPAFLLGIGPNKFTLDGMVKHSMDKDTKESEASWEIECAWHRKESAEEMLAFGSASGNLLDSPEETKLMLFLEYGSDPAESHNVTVTLGSSQTLEGNEEVATGYASLQVSEIPAGLSLEYVGRPSHYELRSNVSVLETQVLSEVVLKDVTVGGGQDSQLTFSVASPQLDVDYKTSGIYRISESGLQVEVELNLGTALKSKVMFTYLCEDDPLHILTGVHLTLDDFVFQAGYSIDMSQPDHFLIAANGAVGEGKAGFSGEVAYGRERPFNASLEVYAGLGMQSFGLAAHTASDPQWHNFTGKSAIKWLDWSGSLAHELVCNDTTKAIKLSLEDGRSLQVVSQTRPDQTLNLVVKDAPGDSSPVFMLAAERSLSSEECAAKVNVTSGDSQLMSLAWNMDSKNEFTLGFHLLESQLDLEGQYGVMDNGTVSGASQAKVTLPSGDVVSANLSVTYATMGHERLLTITGSHEGSVIESKLAVSLGSTEEKAGINFTLTTPHPHLQKFGFDFHRSAANGLYFAEIKLDEFKILGEAQLSDPSDLLFKLEYDGGEECASRLHLQHSHGEQKSFSLASLALTQASEPWELALNTSLDHSNHRQFLDTELGIQAPVMPHPFRFHGMYNVTENEVQLELQTDLGESISLSYEGKKEFSWRRHLLHGLARVEVSWLEPLSVNMTYDHTLEAVNVNIDFKNSGDYLSSWSTEFSAEYSSPEDVKASFYFTHIELPQITMQLVQNKTQRSWKQHLEGSVGTFAITYDINLQWNENLSPTKAEGSLSLDNFFDHNLVLSLSHVEESSTHTTKVTGNFDDYHTDLEHQLGLELPGGGLQASLQASLKNIGSATGGISLETNAFVNLPTINSSLELESPWTDSFRATFLVQEDSVKDTTSFKLDAFHNDGSVLSCHVVLNGYPSYTRSDVAVEVTAVFMEDLELKLQHDFTSGNLILGDVSYGSDVHLKLGSQLKMKETWYGSEFESYTFNASSVLKQLDVDFKSMAAVDLDKNTTLEGHWNENSVSLSSSVHFGKIFEAEFKNPDTNYHSELTYKLGDDILLIINFTLLKDGENLVHCKAVVESVYPKLDATLTLKVYAGTDSDESHGTMLVTADLSKLRKYSLQGMLELKSDLFTSEEIGGKLDLDLSFVSDLSWKGMAGVVLYGGEWNIRSGLNSSLEVSQGLSFEFGAGLHLIHGNQTFDLKDVHVVVGVKSGDPYEMRVILQPNHISPPWSLAVIYNPRFRSLKGFLSLADFGKYELSLRLSTRTLTVDAHRMNEDDSKWQIVDGNINWIIKRTKQFVTLNMKSDIPAISKITGKIIVQQKRDLAVIATLKVNDDQFTGNLRLSTPEAGKSARLDVKVDNSIIAVFESEVTVECSFDETGFFFSTNIGLNQVKEWIQGSIKFSVPESHLKLKTPFSFLESFNVTVRTQAAEKYAVETVIEAPQFCWNLTASLGRLYLHGALDINLDVPCDGDSLFDFHVQYNTTKNPIGVSCEVNVGGYGSIFKFNTTGNLSDEGVDFRIETKAYPQHTFGLELAYQVGAQHQLKLLAYDPPSNETHFSFEALLSHSRTELTFVLSEDQSLLFTADYDFQNQPLRFNSSFSESFFDQLTAQLTGEATLGAELGKIEISFSSNKVFSYLNMSTTYTFQEELIDINFKILTPKGDMDGFIRVLRDKDFYKVEADMESGLHIFKKYHLKVSKTAEDNVEKLEATLAQGDNEYQLSGIRNVTEKGTEASLNVSLPFESCKNLNFLYIYPTDYLSEELALLVRLTLKSQHGIHVIEHKQINDTSQYQLVLNQTDVGEEYVYTLKFSHYIMQDIVFTLNAPQLEGNPLMLVWKLEADGVTAMYISPHGRLGVDVTWDKTDDNITLNGIAALTLFDLGKYHLVVVVPTMAQSDDVTVTLTWVYADVEAEVRFRSGGHFRTGVFGLTVKEGGQSEDYSLVYDFTDPLAVSAVFGPWNLNATLALKGTQNPASSGSFEVRSNLPGYETIDGTWELGQRNWEYFGNARLEMKHQEVLSASATLNTVTEGAYRPWQNVRLTMLLESPFTLPHHLHAEYQTSSEYQTSTPKLLLYYQHGLDTFKMQLNTIFGRDTASLALTGNIPIRGISTFDVNLSYDFANSYSTSLVVKVEDTTLEHKFDFSPDWRVGSVQMALTSPFLRPSKGQFSWSLVQNSVNLNGFFSVGEHNGKMKISLKSTRSSVDFECHVTTSLEELSQLIVNLLYKVSGNNNFDVSVAARLNNSGVLMKSSLDTKGGKPLLKFQGSFEILGNRGSLDVDVAPSGDGYSGSAVAQLPGYKKFSSDLYFDSYQLKLESMYDVQELFSVSATYSGTKVHFYWTEYWSFTLTTEHVPKGSKLLLTVTFAGFGVEPIKLEARYTQKRNHLIDLSLTSSLLPPSTLQITYSSNKITVSAKIGDKSYLMTGRANFGSLKSSFDARFESSDRPDDPVVMKAEYDLTDFLRGRMKTATELAQITLDWGETVQAVVTGQRSGDMAKIDFEVETPLENLPRLHTGFHGEFFSEGLIGFNCTAFVEWSERVEVTTIARLTQADVNVECILTTSFPSLDKLSTSLKLEPGQLQLTVQHNDDTWKAVWEYEFSPFSVTCSLETPIKNFEKISLSLRVSVGDDKMGAQFELSWPKRQKLGIDIEAKRWQVEVNFQTPWEPFTSGTFTASLRTEGEELTLSSVLQMDGREAEMSFVLLSTNFKFSATYSENLLTVGLAKLEYSQRDNNLKVLLEVQTPYESFKLLESSLKYGDNKVSLIFTINEMVNAVEGELSSDGAKLTANIPLLNNFSLSMKSENGWLKAEASVSFNIAGMSEPLTTSFKYDLEPRSGALTATLEVVLKEELMYVDVKIGEELSLVARFLEYSLDVLVGDTGDKIRATLKLAAPELGLESLEIKSAFEVEADPLHLKFVIGVSVQQLGREPLLYKIQGACTAEEDQLLIASKIEGNDIPTYKLIIRVPFGALGLQVVLTGDGSELFTLQYSSGTQQEEYDSLQEYLLPQKLVFRADLWEVEGQLVVTRSSLTASLTLPGPSGEHYLNMLWPEQLTLQELEVSAELRSSYLPQDVLQLTVIYKLPEDFKGKVEVGLVCGEKDVRANLDYHYNEEFRTFTAKFQLSSAWVGDYSLQTNAQWRRNIVGLAALQALGEEHSLSLDIDDTNSAIKLQITSPWLPAGEITFTGEMSSPLNLSNMVFTSKLQAGEEELELEVRVVNDGGKHMNSYAVLRRNGSDVFSLSLEMYEDVTRTDFDLNIILAVEDLKSSGHVRYYNAEWGRYLSGTLESVMLTETVSLNVINSHAAGKLQSMKLDGPDFHFLIELHADEGKFEAVVKLGYDGISFFVNSNIFEASKFSVRLLTSFSSCESLVLDAMWDAPGMRMIGEYTGNGDLVLLRGVVLPDDLFWYCVNAALTTSYAGYERFVLSTPQHKSGKYSMALLEYPGGKVGAEVNLGFQDITDSNFVISLYLPNEKFEIVSVKYIYDNKRFGVEARAGKVGFTISLVFESLTSGVLIESIVGVNEYKAREVYHIALALDKRQRVRYHLKLEPRELTERHTIQMEVLHEQSERFLLTARDSKEEWGTVHVAWGADKILTLATPQFLPGYVHLNFECGSLRDDYRLEFGLMSADHGAMSVYGLQLHQDVLWGGRHLAMMGRYGEYLIGVEGTLSVDSCHLNNSLVFSLNKNKLGYKALLLRESGFLSSLFRSDIEVLVSNRTVLFRTQTVATLVKLNMISDFTWNKMDMGMPLTVFELTYRDDTFFMSGSKHLSAVLSHPDIKDIRLQGNLTRALNASLHGSAELVDDNSPEMKVVARLVAGPAGQDGRQSVSLSLSQPASNLSVLVDAQLQQARPRNEALCRLSYYSLASEAWHHLNLSASLEATDGRCAATVAVAAPEAGWGRTWQGAVSGWQGEPLVSVEGGTDGPGEAWRLGTVVGRHLPELWVYMGVGGKEEVQREARVRLGLHSPVEVGAALDHFSFGQWQQDTAAAGLRLTSPHVLQAFLQFDPSLDYSDSYEWVRLFSPAAEVVGIWSRDMFAAAESIKHWAAMEAPVALKTLFNNETVEAVWQREASNWGYFLKDMEDSYQEVAVDLATLWESVVLPVYGALKDYTLEIYSNALSGLASVGNSVLNLLEGAGQWLGDAWQSLKAESALQEAAVRAWLSEGWISLGESASTAWTDFLAWAAWFGEEVSTGVTTFLAEAQSFFIKLGQTIAGYLSSAYQAIESNVLQHVQPYFEGLAQAFQSYGSDVLAEFTGPCWMALTDKANNLAAMAQGVDGGMRVVTEFLQPEKFSAFFAEAGTWLQENIATVWSSIEGTVSEAVQSLPQALGSWSPPLSEAFSQAWDTLAGLFNRVSAEGLYPVVASMTSDLLEQVMQLPTLLKESIEPVHAYLIQFAAYQSIDGAVRGAYESGEMAWEKWRSGQRTGLSLSEELVFEFADELESYLTSTNYFLDYILVADLSTRGHIHYNQFLPAHWNSFLEPPQWNFPTHLFQTDSAASEAKRLMAAAHPDPSLETSLMPFCTATAVIAGQHVTTFDLQHYQFLGSCSYLLAKDFEGGDFEVFGEYESEAGATRLTSVVVHGPSVDVTLSVDGTVTSRGESAAETISSPDYSALKMPDLFLSCHRALRGCSLTVSSKYFGRLGGLLGNYNGEASDDLHGPDGQAVENVAQLATQWAISPTPCYQANQAHRVEDYSDVEEAGMRECSLLFLHRKSPFSECFPDVDPHPYFTHCIDGHTHPAFSEQDLNAPCTAVEAYRTQCWTRDWHLPNLHKCQNVTSAECMVEDQAVPYGWSQVYEETSHGSADVAVIVELAECNDGREMASLLDHLAKQLGGKNINDVRYAAVAVGEDEPVTKAFLSKREAEAFLNTLAFNESASSENIEAAIAATASGLEWRPGVSRSIVHVGCQPCERGDAATKVLHENDVTYHLVSSLEVEMSSTKETVQARIRKLFGFDENLVYVPTDYKVFRGNEKLRLALRSPKGGCVATALSTGGSVFDSEKWIPKKSIQTMKFLSVLGERVAVTSSPPKCQECHCLKGDSRKVPTCFKCFGNSVFFVTHAGTGTEDEVKDTASITQGIIRSFQEVFLERNNSTMLRIL